MDDHIFELKIEAPAFQNDVVMKFESYRTKAERVDKERAEAVTVIERLRSELNTSRNLEKSQKYRIELLEKRIDLLEEGKKRLKVLSDKQKSSQVAIEKNSGEIIELSRIMQELKEKCESYFKESMMNLNLINSNKNLTLELKSKEETLDLIRYELEMVRKEKEDLMMWSNTEVNDLREAVKMKEQALEELRMNHDRAMKVNKEKIADYEKMIKEMERERRSLLDDYTAPASQVQLLENVQNVNETGNTCPDSTVKGFSQEWWQSKHTPSENSGGTGGMKSSGRDSIPSYPKLSKHRTSKYKPPLEFIESEGNSATNPRPVKRRLYSQNKNHYFN